MLYQPQFLASGRWLIVTTCCDFRSAYEIVKRLQAKGWRTRICPA